MASGQRHSIAPPDEHRALTERFLAALDTGDAVQVKALLAEDAVWIGAGGPTRLAARRLIIGADRVTRGLLGHLKKVTLEMHLAFEPADLNGAPAMIVRKRGENERVFQLGIDGDLIVAVWNILNPDKLRHLDRSLNRWNGRSGLVWQSASREGQA